MSSPISTDEFTERDMDYPVDIDAIDEDLFRLYVAECDRDKVLPSIKNYLVWIEEKYY